MVLAKMTREWLERRIEQADARATARGIALGHAEGRVEEREYLLGALRESNPDLEIPELESLPSVAEIDRPARQE